MQQKQGRTYNTQASKTLMPPGVAVHRDRERKIHVSI